MYNLSQDNRKFMYTQINIKHFAVQEKRQLGREGGAGTGVGGVAIDI